MKPYISFCCLVFMAMLIPSKGAGQGLVTKSDSTWVLMLMHTRTSERIGIFAGQKLQYRLHGSDRYVFATVTGINANKVSFRGKHSDTVSLKAEELAALKILKSPAKRTTGTVLTVIGGLATFVGVVALTSPPSSPDASGVGEASHTAGLIIGAAGLPVLLCGVALKHSRKINLESTWKATLGRYSSDSPTINGLNRIRPRFGIQLNYTTSSFAGFGLGVHGEFFVNHKLTVQPAFDYYFPKEVAAGTGVKESSWTFSGDVHFYFINARSTKLYGLAGVSIFSYSTFTYFASPVGQPGSMVITENASAVGVNVGVGSIFGQTGVRPFAELKYSSPMSGLVITTGIKLGGK